VEALVNPERVKVSAVLTDEEWRVFFLVDGRHLSTSIGYGAGYDVSGEVPALTLGQPITDHGSSWRGTLIDGVLKWEGDGKGAR